MKRIEELRDLSDDHHQGLVLARRAKRASSSNDESVINAVWKEIEDKFITELEPHFQIEETYLVPEMKSESNKPMLKKFYSDHERLRAFFKPNSARTAKDLQSFGLLLEQHIRFEERELFQEAQRVLSEDALNSISKACKLIKH